MSLGGGGDIGSRSLASNRALNLVEAPGGQLNSNEVTLNSRGWRCLPEATQPI